MLPRVIRLIPRLTLLTLAAAASAAGQSYSSAVEVVTVYSQNERFYLKSIPFDDESPSTRGKTFVYEKGRAAPLYVFDRGFDSVEDDSNNLILSDDGEVIFYVIPRDANEEKEGLKSITVYRGGEIIKSYTEAEVNGCDEKRERCGLLYSNYEQVVDKGKSNWGTPRYKKAFKEGVDEGERFLSDFALFSYGDAVYLTDSKKRVHVFDLRDGALVRSDSFDNVFEQIKGLGRFTRTELARYTGPVFLDFPRLKNGRDAYEALASHLGMKPVKISERADEKYKWYDFKVSGYLLRDGSVEVTDLEVDDGLPREKIEEFFKTNKFDSSSVPPVFERWYLREEYFFLRKKDDRLALRERREEKVKEREELQRRLTAETIGGVYIPKDLGEAVAELDKLLSEIDKKEIKALPKRDDMIMHHMGLGMWMRNNWGLWGGSRLQKYFTERGVTHPDEMSSVILYHYHDWLNGRTETWKEWEKNPKQ